VPSGSARISFAAGQAESRWHTFFPPVTPDPMQLVLLAAGIGRPLPRFKQLGTGHAADLC